MRSHNVSKLITGKLVGALFLGVSVIAVASSPASAQITITSEALAEPVTEAQEAAAANNFTAAIAAMRRAAQVEGITAAERSFIQQSILAYMVSARQYQNALTQVESMLANGQGNRNQNLESALRLSLNVGDQAKAERYANDLGRPGDIAIFSAQAAYDRMNFDECIRVAAPLARANRPAKGVLDLLSACHFAKDDFTGQRPILELIALHYPSAEAWDALLRNVRRTVNGLDDEQELHILRLRLLTENFTRPQDYSEMAQLAIISNYPGEAQRILTLAEEAEMAEGERAARLVAMTNERVATHQGQMAGAVTAAQGDATGYVGVKLAQAYNSYEQYEEAEAAARAALAKNPTGVNLQLAQIALGRALLGKGENEAAAAEFGKVEGYDDNSANAVIARLWSIYARTA
jgi:tetratricopeptide (TPR) repeat protein